MNKLFLMIPRRSMIAACLLAMVWSHPITAAGPSVSTHGKGIIFTSHNLRDIFEVADKIVVFRRGQNAGARRPSEATPDEVVKLMVGG